MKHARLHVVDFGRGQYLRANAHTALHGDVGRQHIGVSRSDQHQKACLAELGIRELLEEPQRMQSHACQHVVAVVLPNECARPTGGSRRDAIALEEDDIAGSASGELESDARAGNAATNHHNVGGVRHMGP